MNLSTKSNRGKSLESLVIASQGTVTLTKISAAQKWLGEGKTTAQRQFVDFVGCVNGSGRMICFDCKQWDEKKCRLDQVKPFQRELLRRYQIAGAIAGLLIESTRLGRLYWFAEYPWFQPIEWESQFLTDLGPSNRAVDFAKVPGVLR